MYVWINVLYLLHDYTLNIDLLYLTLLLLIVIFWQRINILFKNSLMVIYRIVVIWKITATVLIPMADVMTKLCLPGCGVVLIQSKWIKNKLYY